MHYKPLLILIVFFFIISEIRAQAFRLELIPYPKEIEVQSSRHVNMPENISVTTQVSDTSGMALNVRLLQQLFSKQKTSPGNKSFFVHLGIPEESASFKELCRGQGVLPDERMRDEGYVLSLQHDQCIIAAHDRAGLFYGVQTLIQLFRSLINGQELPGLRITDWPDFRFRGLHDDISRGPVPTVNFMKEQIRRFAALKLNVLSYYTEHIVATVKHGDFAPAHGGISIEEWQKLDDYARQYHVQLIPNFQSFAHFEKILAYPQYRNLGDTERLLSPVKKESFEFLQDIYSEMAPAFDAPFFIVHGDETWDLGRGDSKKIVDSLGVGTVYADHMKRICAALSNYNKRTIMWADMALQHREILDMLPRETVLGAWDYGARESFSAIIEPLVESGFDVIICPGILNSRRMMPDYRMTLANIRQFIHDGHEHQVMGVLTTVWDDGGEALFSRDWYGVAYAAEQSWNVNNLALSEYDCRFNPVVYGDNTRTISKSLEQLNRLAELEPTQEMNLPVYWQKLLPEPGQTLFLNPGVWEQVKSIADSAEKLFNAAEPRMHEEDLQSIRLTIDQYQYMADSRIQILTAAENYEAACFSQGTNRTVSAGYLDSVMKNLELLRDRLMQLKEAARSTWLYENRTYYLDFVLEDYDEKIRDYERTLQYLRRAISDFREGRYLPPPNEVCLSVLPMKGFYFQEWLLCGPFPNVKDTGRHVDFLETMESEARGIPAVGLVFTGLDGKEYGWQKYTSPEQGVVDLSSVYETNMEVVAYAYCRLESPERREVRATFGSNDGIQVFLNGERIFDRLIKRSLVPDEEEVVLKLNKGYNHLLLKIDQNKGGWGFSFRLPDTDVRNHKHKYSIR